MMEGHEKKLDSSLGKRARRTLQEQEFMKFILKLQPDTGSTGGERFRGGGPEAQVDKR